MEISAFNRRVYYFCYQKKGALHVTHSQMEIDQVWSESGCEKNAWVKVFIEISLGKANQSRVNRLGLASLNSISVLLIVWSSPSCLILVFEVTLGQGENGSNY